MSVGRSRLILHRIGRTPKKNIFQLIFFFFAFCDILYLWLYRWLVDRELSRNFLGRSQSKTSWPPMCYSNHHTDKPHHLPSQSRLFQPEGKLICTCPLQGIQPTAQLASTVQIKQKCFLNSAWRNQGVQQASEHPGSFKSTMVGLHWLFFSLFVYWTLDVLEQPEIMLE